MNRAAATLVALASLGLLLGACGENTFEFNLVNWCGESLCGWQIDAGRIERAPTWHPDDPGASMVGDPTSMAKLVPVAELVRGCMRFTTLCAVDDEAELWIEFDFDDDGTIEFRRTLAGPAWDPLYFTVNSPVEFSSLRVRLVKYGSGEAVIARIDVDAVLDSDECVGPPLPSSSSPDDGGMP